MRKELIWAGIIGISFGLVVAFGAWRINSSLKKNGVPPSPTPTSIGQNSEFKITLNKPSDNDVVTTTPLVIEGITKPLVWVTVSGETGDYILQSDERGIFTQEVQLDPGVNQINVTAFDPKGAQSLEKVLVIFSSAFQTKSQITPTDNSTSSSDIDERVAEKVAQALNQPKAYLGIVTDISDSTIQIKTPESQIEQISTNTPGLTVVNTKGTANKTVKLTDIALGDFIVAMGYVNGNQVLKAQRILVTDPLEDKGISVSFGKVSGITKSNLSIAEIRSGKVIQIAPDKSTRILNYSSGQTKSIKFSAISENDWLIIVTDNSGTNPAIRSVFNIGISQG
jgi:hypothetical protein